MATNGVPSVAALPTQPDNPHKRRWRSFFGRDSTAKDEMQSDGTDQDEGLPTKWGMGVLNDKKTHEVPGSVLLLADYRNEPLGLRNAPARTSGSSLPRQFVPSRTSTGRRMSHEDKKKTKDGAIILEPQPDDSHNDPLNWPAWRRDCALLSLGLYCMIGGGITPILAAGFTNVAQTYNVTVPEVALTTGLYMMGLGLGSVVASPTAILWGKRPVYLAGCILFIVTSIWCAVSPNYGSLVAARIFQGMAVSPVECLPSATIAEIFFLHERAYRIGIYTLLLLGGKNLVPLASAAVIQTLSWRWVFWIVAMIGGFCWVLLFLFVPETFWDRTPRPKKHHKHHQISTASIFGGRSGHTEAEKEKPQTGTDGNADDTNLQRVITASSALDSSGQKISSAKPHRLRVGFATGESDQGQDEVPHSVGKGGTEKDPSSSGDVSSATKDLDYDLPNRRLSDGRALALPGSDNQSFEHPVKNASNPARHKFESRIQPAGNVPPTPHLHNMHSPFYVDLENEPRDYMNAVPSRKKSDLGANDGNTSPVTSVAVTSVHNEGPTPPPRYTTFLMHQPRQSLVQQLKPYNGRLHYDNWFKVAFRPFILFAYPAVLWSSVIYSCSVGWLIVISESVAVIYRDSKTYNFSALSAGLIYLSPFIGGVLGTAVAGKVSDIIVRAMARRNGGLYEPEFRLVMALPVAVTTVIGLMGFGWSAEVHDHWIVPTIFFGIISFGCSLGSTTAITFCVDSYRQYAGEALVTLNFSKNILHGLVFSLFVNKWLEADGSKTVFLALGGIQLGFCLLTVPMYIWGKRARMWTVRMNFMEKF